MENSSSEDDITDRERNALATHISSPHGRVDVAIDFASQIYGFSGHKTYEPAIYECDKYSIWSDSSSVPTDICRLNEKTDFYNTERVYVSYSNDHQTLLLEDEAYKWFMSPERKWSDFNSEDFLEQTFITHTIWRLQNHASALEPWSDLLKEYYAEDEKLLNRVLEILEPKVKIITRSISRQLVSIQVEDIESRVRILVSIIMFGERRSDVELALKDEFERPTQKQDRRQVFRESHLHPLKTHKDKKTVDMVSSKKIILESIFSVFTTVFTRDPNEAVETAAMLLRRDAVSMAMAGHMNRNSVRIYKPWFKKNIIDYTFSKHLRGYIRDYFLGEIKRSNKGTEYDEDFEYGQTTQFARRWSRNRDKKSVSANMLADINVVLGKRKKQLAAYLLFLNGNYSASDVRVRQNLHRACKLLHSDPLTKGKVPMPNT